MAVEAVALLAWGNPNTETKEGEILTVVCQGDLEKGDPGVRRTQSENKMNPGR